MALRTTNGKKRIRILWCGDSYQQHTIRTFDLLGICSAGIMCVYLLGCSALIEGYETMQQVVTSSIIVITTIVIWEIFAQGGSRELLSKQINLVQKEDLT